MGKGVVCQTVGVASHTSPDSPWSPAPCVQRQTVRWNAGGPAGAGQRPVLGQHGLGRVDGSWVFPKAALAPAKAGGRK